MPLSLTQRTRLYPKTPICPVGCGPAPFTQATPLWLRSLPRDPAPSWGVPGHSGHCLGYDVTADGPAHLERSRPWRAGRCDWQGGKMGLVDFRRPVVLAVGGGQDHAQQFGGALVGGDRCWQDQVWAGPVWSGTGVSCDLAGHAASVLRDSHTPELPLLHPQ